MIAKRSRSGKTSRKISGRLAARSAPRVDRPGDVAARPPKQTPHAGTDWVRRYRENNRYECGRLFRRKSCFGPGREYEINFDPDEFRCDLGRAFAASFRPVIVNDDGAAFDPPQFAQPLHKSGHPLALGGRGGRAHAPEVPQL